MFMVLDNYFILNTPNLSDLQSTLNVEEFH